MIYIPIVLQVVTVRVTTLATVYGNRITFRDVLIRSGVGCRLTISHKSLFFPQLSEQVLLLSQLPGGCYLLDMIIISPVAPLSEDLSSSVEGFIWIVGRIFVWHGCGTYESTFLVTTISARVTFCLSTLARTVGITTRIWRAIISCISVRQIIRLTTACISTRRVATVVPTRRITAVRARITTRISTRRIVMIVDLSYCQTYQCKYNVRHCHNSRLQKPYVRTFYRWQKEKLRLESK